MKIYEPVPSFKWQVIGVVLGVIVAMILLNLSTSLHSLIVTTVRPKDWLAMLTPGKHTDAFAHSLFYFPLGMALRLTAIIVAGYVAGRIAGSMPQRPGMYTGLIVGAVWLAIYMGWKMQSPLAAMSVNIIAMMAVELIWSAPAGCLGPTWLGRNAIGSPGGNGSVGLTLSCCDRANLPGRPNRGPIRSIPAN